MSSVYKTEFSANKVKLEKSGRSYQTSQKSDSMVSHQDTLGIVLPQEGANDHHKYHEMVKKKGETPHDSLVDADVTIENESNTLGAINKMQSNLRSMEEYTR